MRLCLLHVKISSNGCRLQANFYVPFTSQKRMTEMGKCVKEFIFSKFTIESIVNVDAG